MKPFDFFSNAVRAKEIFTVLARHGFADLLNQIELPSGVWARFVPQATTPHSSYERIRMAAEELGPTFVKAGQLLSMRPDLLPHPLVLELRKLQSSVQSVPFAEIRTVLVEELEREPEEVFSEFNETPIAAASLAQVHIARLRDGREVAVKIQRPGLEKPVLADFDLLAWLANQAHHRIRRLTPFNLPSVVAELREGVLRELNFLNESRNQQYFNAINPHPDRVYAPAVMGEYSSERLLVMERIIGRRIDDEQIPLEERKLLAARGAESLLHQILIAGFFHADPHSGNVLVPSDGRICLLDWGLAGNLTHRLRLALADLLVAAVEQDAERIVEIAAELGSPAGGLDLRAMERDVTLALREDFNLQIGREQTGRALLKLIHILGRNGINISRDYSLMAKAVMSIEEVGRRLDPSFDLRSHARPILRELQINRLRPRTLWRDARNLVRSSFMGIKELPGELRRIVRRLERDDLTIKFQHQGLEEVDDALKTAANRITLGVIIGSLIVGSSLIITTRATPTLFGYPALGMIGYLLSAVLGLYVVWDIFRHGRHR